MDKKQGIPSGKGVPLIGEKDKIQAQDVVNTLMAQLKPTLDIILENIDGLERRVNVMEEVKQLFPQNITVTIKKER